MENEKYRNILKILKESKPVLNSTHDIENEVIRRISKGDQLMPKLSEVFYFVFGWVYIGWVRRSLITASVILVLVFVWQNSMIIKQINYLSKQTITNSMENGSFPSDAIEKGIMMYKISGRRLPYRNIAIPKDQIKQLLDSADKWKVKYKDLMKLINDDPDLKKLIEKKLNENSTLKTKI